MTEDNKDINKKESFVVSVLQKRCASRALGTLVRRRSVALRQVERPGWQCVGVETVQMHTQKHILSFRQLNQSSLRFLNKQHRGLDAEVTRESDQAFTLRG